MKSEKKLLAIFEEAKNNKKTKRDYYYNFNSFQDDCKNFLKDIRNNKVVMAMRVSRSGTMRRFNVNKYNMLLNICYHGKMDWNEVKVGGCGMDMSWHLLFTTCELIATKGEIDKHLLNSKCSSQQLLVDKELL
jgi:CRISPR/Cas system CMR-associated protein Cmr3 (group 5 of RAMP superfamily)